jgi:hypothetical protein
LLKEPVKHPLLWSAAAAIAVVIIVLVSGGGTTTNSTPSRSGSKVESLSANWVLAQQLNKHKETLEALEQAKKRRDNASFIRILKLRTLELSKAIDEVSNGSYSISDKQKIVNVLEQERAWAVGSAAALSDLPE